ncbi:MAG TPA: hypothetical protein VGX23_08260 [Actinocrinis sp.]|nr:hypothetical protein [Actinocrinis sp.]
MNQKRRRLLTFGAAVTAVLAVPALAWASGPMTSGTVYTGTVAQSYNYTTTTDYWSVVALQPTSTSDYDLSLYNAGGSRLALSQYDAGYTDFVAVDSNSGTEPYGTYSAAVSQYTAGQFWIQAQYGATQITLPTPTHHGTTGFSDPSIAFANLNSNNIVSISDIYLTAGQSFWAVGPNDGTSLFLLEATPGTSSTYVQSRSAAASDQHTQNIDNCTLYTAKQTGWHALVLIGDRAPVNTSPQQGTGIGLHQYDAIQPNYCPLADFPDATP